MAMVLGQRLRAFIPQPLHAGNREIWTACLGVVLSLAVTEAVCRHLPGGGPVLVASMGATALLAFALPSSPLAQPWAIIGGNLVSALVGLACAVAFPHTGLAAGMAVALSIAAMFLLRCLHPPGGALALAMVLTPAGHGAAFIAGPVLANALLLALLADAFNRRLRRGRFQPPAPVPVAHQTADPLPGERIGFRAEDLDRALDEHGELLDIRREDLLEVFRSAEWHAYHRRFGQVRCLDIMARDVVSVHEHAPLTEVWALLARHKVKALPVVDAENRLRGIVTAHDILLGRQGHAFVPSMPVRHGREPVREVMTADVRAVTPAQSIADLAGLFSDGGLHHLPVIDGERRVVGMISQSDLVAALFKLRL